MYKVIFNPEAQDDLLLLEQKCPTAIKKVMRLTDELAEHPRTGTGKVEQLRHYTMETWSRRITREHRLVYQIHDDVVEVIVVSAYGHYKQ